MKTIDTDAKGRFRMGRYMDDVLTVIAKDDDKWDADAFMKDFESSTCYMPPLNLERAEPEYFLETRIELTKEGRFRSPQERK